MTDNVIDLDMRSKEQKKKERKERRKQKWNSFVKWAEEHFIFLTAILGFLGGIFGMMLKAILQIKRAKNFQEEREFKENYVYDRRKGHYVHIRRKLSGQEWAEVDERYDNGESMSSIMEDMKVLK